MASRGTLERPHVRLQLIRELAAGEIKRGELARRYGVVASSITEFAQRHDQRIRAVQEKLDDEFAGLWIASKAARIEVLQEQVDQIADLLDAAQAAEDGERSASLLRALAESNTSTSELMRTQAAALRAVSEELGQLPARTVRHEGGVSVRYVVEGIDPVALQ